MNETANRTERTDNEKATMNAMRIVGEFYGMADRMDGYNDAVLVADVVGILNETTDLNDVTISETLASLRHKRLIDRGCEDKGPDLEYIHFTNHGRAAWDADADAQDTPDSDPVDALKVALQANLTPHAIAAMYAFLQPAHTNDTTVDGELRWFRDILLAMVGSEHDEMAGLCDELGL